MHIISTTADPTGLKSDMQDSVHSVDFEIV